MASRFGEPTDTLIKDAFRDQITRQKLTHEQRLLLILSDGGWHANGDLARAVSHRFGGYLKTLADKGVRYEKAARGGGLWVYRLQPGDPQEGLF